MNKPFILIVDDETDLLDTMVILLKKHFDVYTVNNGKDALDVMEIVKINCLITDAHMPKMDGLAILEKMRDAGYSIKTIVTSGGYDDDLFERFREFGVCGYLQKPFKIEELLSMIERVLSDYVDFPEAELTTAIRGGVYGS